MTQDIATTAPAGNLPMAFGGGAVIGSLGGLIGLGVAEFCLPLLIGPFRFAALEAVILNKAMSRIVIATALVFRTRTVPLEAVATHWPIIFNWLAGSLVGAWFGAGWAVQAKFETLHRIIAAFLAVIMVGPKVSSSSGLSSSAFVYSSTRCATPATSQVRFTTVATVPVESGLPCATLR